MTVSTLSLPRRVTLVVTGGIAAYKACEFLRLLVKAGVDVRVVMTESATTFVGPVTFEALSGHPVVTENSGAMVHIESTRDVDLTIVMPATANTLAKMANGIADTLVSSLLLACRSPILVVPGMNKHMWMNPATKRNVEVLKRDGVHFAGPVSGVQACGDVGDGRMMEPDAVFDLLPGLLLPKTLQGKTVLITTGATVEDIDPVRQLTNRSSGQQGFDLARAFRDLGADVMVIAGKTDAPIPTGVDVSVATSADAMMALTQFTVMTQKIDAFVGVAAVCDYRVEAVAEQKLKKDGTPFLANVHWVENEDILSWVGHSGHVPVVAGFAAETDDERRRDYALKKLATKNLDVIAANRAQDALGSKNNALTLYFKDGHEDVISEGSKREVAHAMALALQDVMLANDPVFIGNDEEFELLKSEGLIDEKDFLA